MGFYCWDKARLERKDFQLLIPNHSASLREVRAGTRTPELSVFLLMACPACILQRLEPPGQGMEQHAEAEGHLHSEIQDQHRQHSKRDQTDPHTDIKQKTDDKRARDCGDGVKGDFTEPPTLPPRQADSDCSQKQISHTHSYFVNDLF